MPELSRPKLDKRLGHVIGTGEAAILCGVTERAIGLAVERGELPAKRIGPRVLCLDRRTVQQYAAGERNKGGRPPKR
jgi:hypothetical protein